MKFKTLAGLIGMVLVIGFLLPPIIKLKKLALAIVVLIGVAMVIYEYVESLREQDD